VKKHLLIIAALILFFSTSYSSNPFSDVPREHWAYDAVRELISQGYLGGYPDGSFKGETTVSRYEMAVTIAKILDKVRDVQTAGGFIDAQEAATIRKLSTEFRDELDSLGIRVGNLEDRVKKLEENHTKLEKDAGKFRIYGSYFHESLFDIKESGFNSNNRKFREPYHSVTLEMLSKPTEQSQFYIKFKNGMTNITEPIKFEPPDKVTYNDTNRLAIQNLNYNFKAPRADTRVYFREGATSLDDPLRIFSNPWHSPMGRDGGSGVEMKGNLNIDTSYYLTAFRAQQTSSSATGDYYIGLRSRYKVPAEIFPEAAITVGGTYAQRFYPYDKDNPKTDFDGFSGLDVEYIKSGDYNFSSNIYVMKTETNVGKASKEDVEGTKGFRMTSNYKKGPLSSNMTFYNYEQGFTIPFIAPYSYAFRNYGGEFSGRPEWYYHWNDVYKYGERYFDMTNSYDLALGNGQNVHVKTNYLKLWWDKEDGTDAWYNHEATRFSLDIYPTFSDKFKAELLNKIWKDPKPGEKGFYKHELKLFTTLNSENNTKLDVGVWSEKDNDKKNLAGDTSRKTGIWGAVSVNATDTIFTKVGFDYGKGPIGWDNVNSPSGDKENRWWTQYLETTVDLAENLAVENSFYVKHSGEYGQKLNRTRFIKSVVSVSFTQRLKGRFGYWWKDFSDGTQRQHTHADLNYSGADGTRLRLEYSPLYDDGYKGFDLENINDVNVETYKRFRFTVSSKF
jgi:hypothetical protein